MDHMDHDQHPLVMPPACPRKSTNPASACRLGMSSSSKAATARLTPRALFSHKRKHDADDKSDDYDYESDSNSSTEVPPLAPLTASEKQA